MSRTAIVVVILVVVVGGIALILRRSPSHQEDLTQAKQISVSGYQGNGRLAWSIEAERGSVDANASALEAVKLTLLRDDDAPIVVSGESLSRNSGGSTLTGSIRIEQADTMSLETETLFWDERNDVLESGPVDFQMHSASLKSGAFHHNLQTGLTTLTQGVEARLVHDTLEYIAHSDSAESSSNQLVLIGNVEIQAENEDTYTCQRLESDSSTSSVHLIGEVIGQWQQSAFTARSVLLDDQGIRMHGAVTIDLDLLMMDDSHDS